MFGFIYKKHDIGTFILCNSYSMGRFYNMIIEEEIVL